MDEKKNHAFNHQRLAFHPFILQSEPVARQVCISLSPNETCPFLFTIGTLK